MDCRMDHRSEVEVCHEQTNVNNNLSIKESSEISKRLQSEMNNSNSNVSFDYEVSGSPPDGHSFFIERQYKLMNLNNNTTSHTLSIKECHAAEKTNKLLNAQNGSNENVKDSYVTPSLSGLKNTALIAVDVIRGKLNTLRRTRSGSNTQTGTRDSDNNVTNGSVRSLRDCHDLDEPLRWDNFTFESIDSIEKRALNNDSTSVSEKSSLHSCTINTHNETTNEIENNESEQDEKTEHFEDKIEQSNFKDTEHNDPHIMSSNSCFSDASTELVEEDKSLCACCDDEIGREQQSEISFTSLSMINDVNRPKCEETKPKNRETYLNGAMEDIIKITQLVNDEDEFPGDGYAKAEMTECSPSRDGVMSNRYESSNVSVSSHCLLCDDDSETVSPVKADDLESSKSGCTLEGDQCNIKLWQVRNHLEETTIEIRCHYANYNNSNPGEYNGNSPSITTDGMTEASPLSTPSSFERALSREKSLSDSDYEYESKGYFVTNSGRLSPLPPPCHCRSNTVVSNSLERSRKTSDIQDDICSCEGQKTPSEAASKNLQLNDLNLQPNSESNSTFQEDTKNNKPPVENKSDLNGFGDQSDSMGDISLSNSPENNKFNLKKTTPAKSGSMNDCRKPPGKKMVKRNSLFSLLNKKIPDTRRVSLPSLEDQKPSEIINKKLKHPFLRRFSNADLTKRNSSNATSQLKTQTPLRSKIQAKRANDLAEKSSYNKSNTITSDDVFLNDSGNKLKTKSSKLSLSAEDINSRKKSPSSKCKHHKSGKTKRATRSMSIADSTPPPALKPHRRNTMFHPTSKRLNSVDDTIPCSSATCSKNRNLSIDESDDSSSSFASSRSSSSRKTLSRFFRRSGGKQVTLKRNSSVPSFCGYSLERDFCVDSETDRIFKEFLFNDNPTITLSPSEESTSPAHIDSPSSSKESRASQLRRQSMKKQNSDSVAIYHGQNQRKMRFTKQRSGSLNYPIDQDRIEEEFDNEEMPSSRYTSTSSRYPSTSRSASTSYNAPTVSDVKKWTRTNDYHIS